jgi:hypothetical protein
MEKTENGENGERRKLTPPEKRALTPIHRQHDPGPETHALREIHTPPQIHGQQAAAEAQPVDVEHGRVADVGQTAEVPVLEGFVDGLVEVAVVDFVAQQARRGLGQLVELAAEVLALLVGALGRRGEGGEFVIDLHEQLVQFAEVQRAALVLVVLLEQAIQAPQVVRGLREALLDFLRDGAPVGEGDVHLGGVFVVGEGEGAEEVGDVVGDVVLHGGAVADGVDGAEGGAGEAEVGVGFEGVAVGLDGEFGGDALAEFGLGWGWQGLVEGLDGEE